MSVTRITRHQPISESARELRAVVSDLDQGMAVSVLCHAAASYDPWVTDDGYTVAVDPDSWIVTSPGE